MYNIFISWLLLFLFNILSVQSCNSGSCCRLISSLQTWCYCDWKCYAGIQIFCTDAVFCKHLIFMGSVCRHSTTPAAEERAAQTAGLRTPSNEESICLGRDVRSHARRLCFSATYLHFTHWINNLRFTFQLKLFFISAVRAPRDFRERCTSQCINNYSSSLHILATANRDKW